MSLELTADARTGRQDPIISVRNLETVFYTDKETIRAVDGVSFDILPGETVGIVGESGSGKSVTARTIMGLIESPGRVSPRSSIRFTHLETVREFAARFGDRTVDVTGLGDRYEAASLFDQLPGVSPETFGYDRPEDASVVDFIAAGYEEELGLVRDGVVDGDDCIFVTGGDGTEPDRISDGFIELTRVDGESQRAIRGGNIAMVFQDPLTSLNPVYTVGNQIKEALRLHRGLSGREATREAIGLLEDVGIPDARRRVEEYPHQFSGGMRQRAVIAMALACDPEVLICDEPTTALDVTIQAQILELLETLQDERDLAIMFITHDMGVIADVSDRVNVMYAGEIVETADVETLFADPKHPYTQGLLRSIPGQQSGDRLETIGGKVPTPNEVPSFCRFAPRCPEAFDACHSVHPTSIPVDDDTGDHTAACLLYPEGHPEGRRLEIHTAADSHPRRAEGDQS